MVKRQNTIFVQFFVTLFNKAYLEQHLKTKLSW